MTAVKFTDTPGKVSFTTEELSEEDGICRMKFKMRDTGIGMDPEYIPKIFETFSQEDASNTNSYGGSGYRRRACGKNGSDCRGGRTGCG